MFHTVDASRQPCKHCVMPETDIAAVGIIRPGLLDRLQIHSGIKHDDAFAASIGVSRATLARLKEGDQPSLATAIRIARTFGLGLGEVVEMVAPDPEHAEAVAS